MSNQPNSAEKGRLLRSTAAVSGPTLVSRILGFVRDFFLAYYLGTGAAADAFTIAFNLPNLLRRLVGEGALSASFVPALVDLDRKNDRKRLEAFGAAFFADAVLVMASLTALGMIFTPALVRLMGFGFAGSPEKLKMTVAMTRVMFPYVFFIVMAALAAAALNARGKFLLPAANPIAFNLAMIAAAVFWAGRSARPAEVFAAAVLVGGALQLAMLVPPLMKEGLVFGFRPSFRNPDVRAAAGLLLPAFLGVGVYQINFALSRIFASGLEQGSASSLYFASRVEELTLGLFSIALSVALLPHFSASAAADDREGMRRTLGFSLKLTTLVTMPAAAGLIVLSRPVISVLFERGRFGGASTGMSAACLVFFAAGLPFISGVKIIGPAFYSLKDARTPVRTGLWVIAANVAMSLVLAGPLRVAGLAVALSLAEALNFVILFVMVQRKLGRLATRELAVFTGKTLVAAAVMAAAVKLIYGLITGGAPAFAVRALALFGAIAAGMAVYAAAISLLVPGGAARIVGMLRDGEET